MTNLNKLEVVPDSIERVAPHAPTTAELRLTPNTMASFRQTGHDTFMSPQNSPYFDKHIRSYLPPDVYEDFLNSAMEHRTFRQPDIDFEEFLNYFQTNNKEVGKFTTLNSARMEFISGVNNAFSRGKWQPFLEPNFLRQLTEHIPKCFVESGESYQPDLVLTDFFATLKLLASRALIGTLEEKQGFTTEGFNTEYLAVLNHWAPNTKIAAEHLGQLTLNYLQSQDVNRIASTLARLTNPEQLRDQQMRNDLLSIRYCFNVIGILLFNHAPTCESVQANNKEVIRQYWPLIDATHVSSVSENKLSEGKQSTQQWLDLLRRDLPIFMPEIINSWREVGKEIDPQTETVEEYYQSLATSQTRVWDQNQHTLIEYIQQDETIDQKALLSKISESLGLQLSEMVGSSPSQAATEHSYSLLFSNRNSDAEYMSLTNPQRRILIDRREKPESAAIGALEEWAYCEGSFKNSFHRQRVDGLYGPINTLTEEQYARFVRLMRVTAAYYPIVLNKQMKKTKQNVDKRTDKSTEPDQTTTTTPYPEYSSYS